MKHKKLINILLSALLVFSEFQSAITIYADDEVQEEPVQETQEEVPVVEEPPVVEENVVAEPEVPSEDFTVQAVAPEAISYEEAPVVVEEPLVEEIPTPTPEEVVVEEVLPTEETTPAQRGGGNERAT